MRDLKHDDKRLAKHARRRGWWKTIKRAVLKASLGLLVMHALGALNTAQAQTSNKQQHQAVVQDSNEVLSVLEQHGISDAADVDELTQEQQQKLATQLLGAVQRLVEKTVHETNPERYAQKIGHLQIIANLAQALGNQELADAARTEHQHLQEDQATYAQFQETLKDLERLLKNNSLSIIQHSQLPQAEQQLEQLHGEPLHASLKKQLDEYKQRYSNALDEHKNRTQALDKEIKRVLAQATPQEHSQEPLSFSVDGQQAWAFFAHAPTAEEAKKKALQQSQVTGIQSFGEYPVQETNDGYWYASVVIR